MRFLLAINSDISVLTVCNKTGGTIKGDIKKKIHAEKGQGRGRHNGSIFQGRCCSNTSPLCHDMAGYCTVDTTLVNDRLGTKFLSFMTCLFHSSTCFEQHCAHHQEVKLY